MLRSRLSDIAEIVMGQSPSGETCNQSGDGVPLLNGPTEFGSHHPTPVQFTTNARKLAMSGALLFCVRGSTTGRMNWADQEYAIGRGVAAIQHRTSLKLQPLIRGIVEIQLPSLLQAATGSTFPNVSAKQLANLVVPDLTEKQMLWTAALLGSLDDKIELNRRMNETLEAMARAIFKDWFVDFGPTRAKADDRAPYLAPELWDLFPNALDDEGKPCGWKVQPVSELFQLNPREHVKKLTYTPYLDMAALPQTGIVADAPKIREYKSGSKFRDGDTLFARITPCLENGKTAYVFDLGKNAVGAGSTEFIVIRAREPLPKPTSYILARNTNFRAHAERHMTGTSGRQRVNHEALAKYQLTVPDDERLWDVLGDYVNPLIDRVIVNARESQTLAQTRDLLLPKLMSGEIRLQEAEKAVEATA